MDGCGDRFFGGVKVVECVPNESEQYMYKQQTKNINKKYTYKQ